MMRKIVTFVLLLICLSVTSVAQMGGGMTDKQVVEYVQNGLLQGKSQQQISTELARRGVTKEQAERVKLLYELPIIWNSKRRMEKTHRLLL